LLRASLEPFLETGRGCPGGGLHRGDRSIDGGDQSRINGSAAEHEVQVFAGDRERITFDLIKDPEGGGLAFHHLDVVDNEPFDAPGQQLLIVDRVRRRVFKVAGEGSVLHQLSRALWPRTHIRT
jgi:hypothetical protein